MTLFLMPNEVHKMMMAGDMGKSLTGRPDMLRRLIGRHVVLERIMPFDIHNDMIIMSVSGDRLRFNIYGNV